MNEERSDKIKEAAKERANQYSHPAQWNDVYNGFISGARWSDGHPDTVDMSYLQNWYQDSVDETQEPIWTDKHLEELFNDFYLIPKKNKVNYGNTREDICKFSIWRKTSLERSNGY